jgi:hypothetical protein
MKTILFASLVCGLAACSSPTVNTMQKKGAAMMQQHTADMVKGLATKTAPMGGTSMGMMSNPTAGNTTIPIANVEVFVFTANIDDDPSPETLYWAADDQAVYVWGEINITCVDDNGDPDGETGVATFIYEDGDAGSGWMVATDACGYSTLYGCSAPDAEAETCGGCDWNADFVVCSADE